MQLSLGFSPCPNDTFIFGAIVNQLISTNNIEFNLIIEDVEQLNHLAMHGEIDIIKISYHAFAYVSDQYQFLRAGSALGNNNGPLLISKHKIYPDEVNNLRIAIPGKHTTANLLMNIAYPEAQNKTEYLFSDIEEAILSNEVDAGVIIHENRFTYQKKGLKKIVDLGELWETQNQLPIPLGGIAIKRSLPNEIKIKINELLKTSICFAHQNPSSIVGFIKKHAQSLNEEIIKKHIDLYVNNYTTDIGITGKQAVEMLYKKAEEFKLIYSVKQPIFIEK